MNSQLTKNLANHIREMHFGKNWSWANLQDHLKEVTIEEAKTKVDSCNSILALAYHINYYIDINIKVLMGGPLEGSDKFSFDHPDINSNESWQELLNNIWAQGNQFADLVEQMPEEKLWDTFSEKKYGNYYRNILGVIEHTHYHLGQIVILKKMITKS